MHDAHDARPREQRAHIRTVGCMAWSERDGDVDGDGSGPTVRATHAAQAGLDRVSIAKDGMPVNVLHVSKFWVHNFPRWCHFGFSS